MKGLRLYKVEKLCGEVAVARLFNRSDPGVSSSLAYPVRLAWRVDDSDRGPDVARFLVSVPKKRIRHAVDRVTVRRRIREAYRLHRHLLPAGVRLHLAFIYVADDVLPSARIVPAVCRLLGRVGEALASQPAPGTQS